MKQVIAELPDEQVQQLEDMATRTGVPLAELVARSVAAYLERASRPFNPVGFGMWKDREDMADPARWLADFRENESRR